MCRSETLSSSNTHRGERSAQPPGAATCSVESLKDGLVYTHNTGSINRMRFDMLLNSRCLCCGRSSYRYGVDAHNIDEIVYVGKLTYLPTIEECNGVFREEIGTFFT